MSMFCNVQGAWTDCVCPKSVLTFHAVQSTHCIILLLTLGPNCGLQLTEPVHGWLAGISLSAIFQEQIHPGWERVFKASFQVCI